MTDRVEDTFNFVFQDGIPKHVMLVGKHDSQHRTVQRDAIAKAYRLDQWLGDVLAWNLWWEALRSQRENLVNEGWYAEAAKYEATIRALQAEVGELREEYAPKSAAWDAACSVPRKVQKQIATALIFAANVTHNLDQGAWDDCPKRYRDEFYRFAEDIQAALKPTPGGPVS